MSINVTVAGFIIRYPNTRISSADIGSVWLFDAAEWVHSQLAEKFTVPFSTSNLTAARLTYQKAWHLIRLRALGPTDSDEIGEALEKQIQGLNDGEFAMVLLGDEYLYAASQQTDPQNQIWSNTMDYSPTFDMDEPERERVDPDHIDDIRRDRQ